MSEAQKLVPYRQRAAAPLEILAPPISPVLALLDERVDFYKASARARSTRHTYARCWLAFEAWCEAHQVESFTATPETVRRYIAHLADCGKKPSTIGVACAAIRAQHFDASHYDPSAHPSVKTLRAGIRREVGGRPQKKRALPVQDLSDICKAIPAGIQGARDRALLLLGFGGAFRRAALVNLDVDDLEFLPGQVRVFIERDKQDQEAMGRTVVVVAGKHSETCPVRALLAWIALLGREDGPLFVRLRNGRRSASGGPVAPPKLTTDRLCAASVATILKIRGAAIELDVTDLAGHSLRSGLATAAANAGKQLGRIMAQTGHSKPDTAMGYIQDAEAGDENNASAGIGL